jgi:hypothetical protein
LCVLEGPSGVIPYTSQDAGAGFNTNELWDRSSNTSPSFLGFSQRERCYANLQVAWACSLT